MKAVKIQQGSIFGHWKVISFGSPRSLCICICNTEKKVLNRNLRLGKSTSCGCQKIQSTKSTNIKKYGTENYVQSDQRKSQLKQINKKRSKTNIEKYGTECPSKSDQVRQKISQTKKGFNKQQNIKINQKRKQTCLEKYNVDNIGKADWKVQKTKNTMLKLYGVDIYSKTDQCKQRIKQTNIERYGVDNYSKTDEFKQKLIDLGKKHVLSSGEGLSDYAKSKGVPQSTVGQIYNKYGEATAIEYIENYSNNLYSTEAAFISLIKDCFPEISKWDKKPVEFDINRRPDFRLVKDQKVVYVNIDGLFDHSEISRRKLDKNYHYQLAESFRCNNVRLMQFRSDELEQKPLIIKSMILNYFGITEKLNARDLLIKKIDSKTASDFLNQNHLMGTRQGITSFGLFNNQQLVAVLAIQKQNNTISIERFCTKIGFSIRGGFSKLLKHIENLYNPDKIESFCDLRYSTGLSYEKCGFTLSHIDNTGFVWTDFKKTYNRRMCRANMDDRKLTQIQYSKQLGWYKIYDAGQAKYVKEIV